MPLLQAFQGPSQNSLLYLLKFTHFYGRTPVSFVPSNSALQEKMSSTQDGLPSAKSHLCLQGPQRLLTQIQKGYRKDGWSSPRMCCLFCTPHLLPLKLSLRFSSLTLFSSFLFLVQTIIQASSREGPSFQKACACTSNALGTAKSLPS